jgi:hypothetical protein
MRLFARAWPGLASGEAIARAFHTELAGGKALTSLRCKDALHTKGSATPLVGGNAGRRQEQVARSATTNAVVAEFDGPTWEIPILAHQNRV